LRHWVWAMAVQGIFNLKFLGPISFAILILGALGFTQEAEATSFTATQNGDWNVGSTWVGGVAPITITSGDIVSIPSGITVTIPSGVTIIVFSGGTINNFGTIINNSQNFGNFGTINNSGTINNNSGGNISNFGTINNFGTIINNSDSILQNAGTGSTINNSGLITNNGFLFNGGTGTINNFGNIENFGELENTSRATINNFCGSSFINEDDSILNFGIINGVNLISGEPVEDREGTTTEIFCSTGGGAHESPTIGKNRAGIQIVPSNGICIDAQCWTVTEFDTGFKLLPLLSSSHTITNTIFCNEGVQECDYVGVSFMTSTDLFGELVMMVEAQKTDGEWAISWYDPQDFIHDPGDYLVGDPRGAITFTAQIVNDAGFISQNGNFLLTSFTIDFKNKDTGELVIRIQVGDDERGQSTFWFNEGVEIIDSDAYPSIETEFENPLEIDSLCLNEDPDYRYSCAFAKKIQLH